MLTIFLIAIIVLVVILGFKNGWDVTKMGAGALAMLALVWDWIWGLFAS